MKFFKELVKISLIVLVILVLSNLFNFRVCIIYNLFHIPCPGCGITRSINFLLHGNIKTSIQYSIVPYILLVILFIVSCWKIYDHIKKVNTISTWITKHKNFLIFLSILIFIIIEIININNPLLYN